MNVRNIIYVAAALSITAGLRPLSAAEEQPLKPIPRDELREQLRGLTPEERKAKIKEMRERGEGPFRDETLRRREALRNLPTEERQSKIKERTEKMGVTNRAEFEKLREDLRSLPPQERAAKLRELREKSGRPILSDEDRNARRKEVRQRLDAQIDQLRKKKADGSITEPESRRLQRLEQIAAGPLQDEQKPTPEPK